MERIAWTLSQSPGKASGVSKKSSESGYVSAPESTSAKLKVKVESSDRNGVPTAPVRPSPTRRQRDQPWLERRLRPVLNMGACRATVPKVILSKRLEYVRRFNARAQPRQGLGRAHAYPPALPGPARTVKTLSTGYVFRRLLDFPFSLLTFFSRSAHPILPQGFASDIRQFVESGFAQHCVVTHRTGFIFKRKVPDGQMMTWQLGPLAAPVLNLARPLHKDGARTFRAVQRLDSEKGVGPGT